MTRPKVSALLAFAALVLPLLFPPVLAQNADAQIIIYLQPSATVNATYQVQVIRLEGNVTVIKPPKVLLTVYLSTTSEGGWNCDCSPDTIYFTDFDFAAFTCAVSIPAKEVNTTAAITIHALCDGFGTTGEAYASATITVVGNVPTNGTIEQAPPTWGLNSPLEKAVGLTLPAIALVAVVITVSVTTAALFVRRRKRRLAAPPPQ
jgi:hypothetical protein